MATIYEVAKQAGVSTATVSRSFSKTSLLSEETRQRVLEVARQLNYRPRRSTHLRPETVTAERRIVLNDPIAFQFFAISEAATVQNNAFYAPLLQGAQAEAEAMGLPLLLYTMYRHSRQGALPPTIRNKQVAGMLLVGTADPEILAAFCEYVPQIVLVDNRDLTDRHDSIVSDGFSGAFAAARYLIELGHRRIGFVLSEPQTLTFRDRLHGYVAAHFESGLPIDPDWIVSAETTEDFGPQVHVLLASPHRPTALLAANDVHAYLVMQIARDLGLDIPQDLSLIGFDDEKYSALAYPSLTTVHVDSEMMGRLAIRRLLQRLKEAEHALLPERPVQIQVPVSLVVRNSCCAFRA